MTRRGETIRDGVRWEWTFDHFDRVTILRDSTPNRRCVWVDALGIDAIHDWLDGLRDGAELWHVPTEVLAAVTREGEAS